MRDKSERESEEGGIHRLSTNTHTHMCAHSYALLTSQNRPNSNSNAPKVASQCCVLQSHETSDVVTTHVWSSHSSDSINNGVNNNNNCGVWGNERTRLHQIQHYVSPNMIAHTHMILMDTRIPFFRSCTPSKNWRIQKCDCVMYHTYTHITINRMTTCDHTHAHTLKVLFSWSIHRRHHHHCFVLVVRMMWILACWFQWRQWRAMGGQGTWTTEEK